MKSTPRVRAALAVGALMTAVGLGAVATPFLAAASASTVDSTPSSTIFKADYEAAHPGVNNAWGQAMSNPSDAFCGGDEATSISFSGNTTAALAENVGKVVIHAGSYVFIWTPGIAGVQYQTPKVDINGNMNSQAISWAVTCGEGESSSSSSSTSTSTSSSSTSTSSSSTSTSSSSTSAPAETTTAPAETTTAPVVVVTTTSAPAETTTAAGGETVDNGSTADTASTTPAGSLAQTGGNGPSGLLVALGLLLAVGGTVLMALTRRTGSHA